MGTLKKTNDMLRCGTNEQIPTHLVSLAQQVVRQSEVICGLLAVPQQAPHLAARDVQRALVLEAGLLRCVEVRQRLQI